MRRACGGQGDQTGPRTAGLVELTSRCVHIQCASSAPISLPLSGRHTPPAARDDGRHAAASVTDVGGAGSHTATARRSASGSLASATSAPAASAVASAIAQVSRPSSGFGNVTVLNCGSGAACPAPSSRAP